MRADQLTFQDICLVCACAAATPRSASFDNDLLWRSVDLNQDEWTKITTVFEELASPKQTRSVTHKVGAGVNSKVQLSDSIRGDVMLIEADVSMGVIAGGDGTLLPVMAHPPLNTSDLSLEEFLDTIHRSNTSKGIKLDFKSLEVVEPSLIILKSHAHKITDSLWLNADILPGPVNASTKPVDAARFLELVKAYFPDVVLSVGWTTRFGPQLSWPLQIINKGSYTMDHAIQMRDVLKAAVIQQPITFPVRAGLFTSPEAQKSILWLLKQFENSSLTVWSSTYDIVDVPRLIELVSRIGKANIYMDVPSGLNCEIQNFEE